MTDHSAAAVASAISLEVKKTGLSQGQGADWRLSFKIEESELCDRLRRAVMGTRYQMVLVELNEDETPKEVTPSNDGGTAPVPTGSVETTAKLPDRSRSVALPVSESDSPARARKQVAPEKRLAQQCGIMCSQPMFQMFLVENHYATGMGEEAAAIAVRGYCGDIKTRAEIVPGSQAAIQWENLSGQFEGWKRL